MALREGRELLFPPPARPRLLSSRSKERVAALFLKAPNRRALTLCFPRRLRLRHKLHLGQWKKSSLGPILGNDHGISGRHAPAATNPRRRTAPADAALVAVVLLLVAVEEMAHVAVVLPEEAAAALAALLGLPADGDTRPLGERRPPPPKMAAPPPRGRATPPPSTRRTFCRRRQRVHCTSATRKRSRRCSSAPSWHSRQGYSFPQHGACNGTARLNARTAPRRGPPRSRRRRRRRLTRSRQPRR